MLSTIERPTTGRGSRDAGPERPRTSKGRRAGNNRDPLHQSSYVPSQMTGDLTPRQSTNLEDPIPRPTTAKGFRDIQSTDFEIVEFEGIERPKTSRGRRAALGEEESQQGGHGYERPTTSRGYRGRPQEEELLDAQVASNSQSQGDEVNILKLDTEPEKVTPKPKREGVTRPKSRYGQRSRLANPNAASPRAYPQKEETKQQPEKVMTHTPSPQPPMRPPSARARDGTPSIPSESDLLMNQEHFDVGSPRPTSASSLSKYNILPSIPRTPSGPRAIPTPPGETRSNSVSASPQPVPVSPQSITPRSVVTLKPKAQQAQTPQTTPNVMSLKPKVEQVPPAEPSGQRLNTAADTTPVLKPVSNEKVIVAEENAVKEMHNPLTREITLPGEPAEDKPRVLLAVKLPNGQRVQRYFCPSDQLIIVLNFAEISSKFDLTDHVIVCDAPRKIFSNMSTTIQESGLENRTVVHIQFPDE